MFKIFKHLTKFLITMSLTQLNDNFGQISDPLIVLSTKILNFDKFKKAWNIARFHQVNDDLIPLYTENFSYRNQKYCRMLPFCNTFDLYCRILPLEHSAILLTCIKG